MPLRSVELRGGVRIPAIGLGTWQVPDAHTQRLVEAALEVGYRHLDTAAFYGNERGVGAAVRASGLPREELFVTTKVWNDRHGYDAARRAYDESLDRLGLDHVDLYLIHWPKPSRDRYVETWRALVDLQYEGLVGAVGVSNFQPAHLDRLRQETGVEPAVNQIEVHPYLGQAALRAIHRRRGIATAAWSPLARGGALLTDPVITRVAREVGRSPGQVVLRWHLQQGNVVIPKTATPARLAENLDLEVFELSPAQEAAISGLDRGQRVGPDPDAG